MQKFVFGVLLFCFSTSWAQEFEVLSHYPKTALVVQRLLPFEVKSEDTFKLFKINISNGKSCKTMLDPYHEKVFHIQCRYPELLDMQVQIFDNLGNKHSLEISSISIAQQRAPLPSPVSVERTPFEEGEESQ